MTSTVHATLHTATPSSDTAAVAADVSQLSWPQRLHLMNKLQISKQKAMSTFHCSQNTLKLAQAQHQADTTFDVTPYETMFADRKRGRKSEKIQLAYDAVTTIPQELATFCQTHGVSINTISQRERFGRGDIVIRTNRETKCREIYLASQPTASSETQISVEQHTEVSSTETI